MLPVQLPRPLSDDPAIAWAAMPRTRYFVPCLESTPVALLRICFSSRMGILGTINTPLTAEVQGHMGGRQASHDGG